MKLQNFFEHYTKNSTKTPPHTSPQHSRIFRTSQSIGTLNSNDDLGTQRSFVVKEQTLKTENNEDIEHLRQICTTEKQMRKMSHQICSDSQSLFGESRVEKEMVEYSIPFVKNDDSMADCKLFAKHKGKGEINNADISLGAFPDQRQSLYEEAPSALYQGCLTEETLPFMQQAAWFMDNYNKLSQQMSQLQNQNKYLSSQLQKSEGINSIFTQKQSELSQQLHNLRQQVTQVIQENIETENKIKQMLLRQEIEKYQFITKDTTLANTKQQMTHFHGNFDHQF